MNAYFQYLTGKIKNMFILYIGLNFESKDLCLMYAVGCYGCFRLAYDDSTNYAETKHELGLYCIFTLYVDKLG